MTDRALPGTERFELVATVSSRSRKGVFYQIKRDCMYGHLSCNCPAWIFQKGGVRKPCKHIKAMSGAEARV